MSEGGKKGWDKWEVPKETNSDGKRTSSSSSSSSSVRCPTLSDRVFPIGGERGSVVHGGSGKGRGGVADTIIRRRRQNGVLSSWATDKSSLASFFTAQGLDLAQKSLSFPDSLVPTKNAARFKFSSQAVE